MHPRTPAWWLALSMSVIIAAGAAPPGPSPIPPGRQHRLTIEGENTVTFLPQAGLGPSKIDYRARVEYIVDNRLGKEPRPQSEDIPDAEKGEAAAAKVEASPRKKAGVKAAGVSNRPGGKEVAKLPSKIAGAVDLSLHSSEMTIRQDGRPFLETRLSRTRFQGRQQPDSPVMSVSAREAPPRLQEILKGYDTIAATMLVDDEDKVIARKFRNDGPQGAILETLLSLHTPIPRGAESWKSPTRLAMGHGQTARGDLLFEKPKTEGADAGKPVKVKVSGVLRAEGAVAGRFIKDGTYTVTGEQTFDPHAREWIASRWSVVVDNELANQAGQVVARARGTMTVETKALDANSPAGPEAGSPKL